MNVWTGLVHAEAPLAHRLTRLRRRNGRYGAASKAQLMLIICGKISLDFLLGKEKKELYYFSSSVDTVVNCPIIDL